MTRPVESLAKPRPALTSFPVNSPVSRCASWRSVCALWVFIGSALMQLWETNKSICFPLEARCRLFTLQLSFPSYFSFIRVAHCCCFFPSLSVQCSSCKCEQAINNFFLVCPSLLVSLLPDVCVCVCVCVCPSLQLVPSPPAVPWFLRRTSRPARCCCRGSPAATACRPCVTTRCSSESFLRATGPSTPPPSTTRPPPT